MTACMTSKQCSCQQVRQLLLDPAVNREFAALRAEVEAKGREVKALQQELQAVNFSQDSKTGRMLMAKCRTLQVGMHEASVQS
jgi:pre-mRNA-splicing regulator WTAP